jgi:RNA-binding protein YhbY
VKVRVLAERDDRPVITEALAAATRSEMVGNVGKTVLLYRAEPKLGAKRIRFPGTPAS